MKSLLTISYNNVHICLVADVLVISVYTVYAKALGIHCNV